MASQTWQKWYEFKITYRVSVIDVWDRKSLYENWKPLYENKQSPIENEKLTYENNKSPFENRNHQSRKKSDARNAHYISRFRTVYEEQKSPFEISISSYGASEQQLVSRVHFNGTRTRNGGSAPPKTYPGRSIVSEQMSQSNQSNVSADYLVCLGAHRVGHVRVRVHCRSHWQFLSQRNSFFKQMFWIIFNQFFLKLN